MSQVTDPPRTPPEIDPRPFLSHPDALYEVVDGKIVEQHPMGTLEVSVANWLYFHIQAFLIEHALGRVRTEATFLLDDERNLRRRPDVAFLSYDRWPDDRPLPHPGDWPAIPDLAVEIVSPNDLYDDVRSKTAEYFAYGVRQVWIVETSGRSVWIFTSPTQGRLLLETDSLDGGDVLPGFSLPIARLFDDSQN
jgi:Uma2 family endonuclease